MFGYYNGKFETCVHCQSHHLLHAGYRYKFRKFYECGGEIFVEIEGIDNHADKDANSGFNLKWFSTMNPVFAFSHERPMKDAKIEVEKISKEREERKKDTIKVWEVHQIAVDTFFVFADDYMQYIVQII